MALQVWLPLNGTLENKGLSNVTVTNNGATVDNNGKIGKCYSVDGSSHYIEGSSFTAPSSGEFSVCGWYYHTSNKSWARLFELTNLISNGASGKTCVGLGLLSGTTPTMFSVKNGTLVSNVSTAKVLATGKWYHWAVVYNKTNVKAYIDGILVKEGTLQDHAGSVFTYTFFGKSSWTSDLYLNGKMNDLRIYDHALSAKEVKEISKGLILHYKLDGNDIGLNDIGSQYDTQIYTEPDGSKWKRIFHHNNPASNLFAASDNFPAGVYKSADMWFDMYSTLYQINKFELMIKLKQTTSSSEMKFRWILAINPITATWEEVRANITRITTSGYTDGGQGGLYVYANSSTTNHTHMVIANSSKGNWWGAVGAWEKYLGGIPACSNYVVSTGYMDLYIRIDNLGGFNTFYDSSGYCNHGSITGTLTTNSDSPRYTKSTVFNGGSIIDAPIKPTGPFTISGWFNRSNEAEYLTYYAAKDVFQTWICLENSRYFVYDSSGNAHIGTYTSTKNTWQHIVLVYTGSNLSLYINGSLISQISNNNTLYSSNTLNIGGRQGNASYAGKMSDFRIYCTALSEDDVKELYNTSAFVTNNGVFAEYELYEDNLSDVKKRGLLETANFYENGAESGYALDTDKTRVASNYIISEDFIEI